MKMAVDGKGRDEIAAALNGRFQLANRDAILDDVLSRAGRS